MYDDRKPSVCGVVPLDASLPDAEQPRVLAARRREAHFWGADCIREQPAPGYRELTRHLRVVDPEAESALARQRREQADEDRYWVQGTARAFGPDLLDRPERVRTVPEHGALTLSLVPVLSLLAATSPACRERIRGFVRAQNRLKAELIERALARRNPADRAETALLRRLLRTSAAFEIELERAPPSARALSAEHVAAVEAWLSV